MYDNDSALHQELASLPAIQQLFTPEENTPQTVRRADALVNEIAAPILNKHVAAGKLLTWGYMGVYIGNQNNRSIYVWAADPVALVQARVTYLAEINGNPKFQEFVKICGSATITLHNLITTSPAPAR